MTKTQFSLRTHVCNDLKANLLELYILHALFILLVEKASTPAVGIMPHLYTLLTSSSKYSSMQAAS